MTDGCGYISVCCDCSSFVSAMLLMRSMLISILSRGKYHMTYPMDSRGTLAQRQ